MDKPRCTADCVRDKATATEPPSCILCGTQGHPANYRGCPRAPRTQPRAPIPSAPRQINATRNFAVASEAPSLRPNRPNAWARPLAYTQAASLTPAPAQTAVAPPALQQAPQPHPAPKATPKAPTHQAPNPSPPAPKAPAHKVPAPQAKPQPTHSPAADIKLVRDFFGQINVGEMFVIAAKLRATNGEGNIMDRLSILAEHVDFCYAISSFHAP
ncbi:predicted GPI-anchored protein 58 [Ostrinia furnacalis]|uniref:predicted GPI-anchored protein 58 n=1 Tax=Ostrinia furnacalis TaxID=93504 RepID=UPI00103B1C99|nr:predicted GPI-anchored protein 58 [Ostrinia furnacalis]